MKDKMLLSHIIQTFERRIPKSLQEPWDQCGLNIGSPEQNIAAVLFSYDVTLDALRAARANKCGLVVSHHPFRLKGEATIRTDTYEGRLIEYCLKNDMALYASHTNHDASADSLNFHYLKRLGLKDIKPLTQPALKLFKLTVYVPVTHTARVMDALFAAGAGKIGNYGECSFRVAGTGTFKGGENTNPAIGKKGRREEVHEERVEVILPTNGLPAVVAAIKKTHPYEEVAYDVYPLENRIATLGIGACGDHPAGIKKTALIPLLKKMFGAKNLRFISSNKTVYKKIGICTGSGASLIPKAVSAGLDLFITGDVKYHQAVEAKRHDLAVADVGHFYSEHESVVMLKEIFEELFGKKLKYHLFNRLKDPFEFV